MRQTTYETEASDFVSSAAFFSALLSKPASKTTMANFPYSHSWIFRGFPGLDPDTILSATAR